jgi:hypothetical protein
MYLKDLGFSEEIINTMIENIPALAVEKLNENEKMVTANIKYLINLGVTNYIDAFVKFYNIFLVEEEVFDDIFSKYDSEDLVAKLEKNVAIMEYL